MFTLEDNAGKLALYELIQKISHKTHWIDTQMVTPVSQSFGAKYIDRSEYLHLLKDIDWGSLIDLNV
jgi:Leu/Phe-tRNA-protein transferase